MYSPITTHWTVAELVDHWLQHLRVDGRLEGTTINEYERVLHTLIVPALGGVRLPEITTERINAVLADLGMQSVNRQRKAKVVTGAMFDLAVMHGVLQANPVRGSLSISRPKTSVRALTTEELDKVRAAVRVWLNKDRPGPKSSGDLADILELMLATGTRVGEVLALRWCDVDLHAKMVAINATIKTEPGSGTYRKTLQPHREVGLPESAVIMLDRRHRAQPQNAIDAVFPTRNATWQQVNNVERRWRQIREEAGLDWVTPDLFRRNAPHQPLPRTR
jgi:integrase